MKKISSAVWKFFERIEENNRCVAVLCKLCECQYKYFGNTTNLRVHLINKHPIQWDLSESGTLDESSFQTVNPEGSIAGTTNNSVTPKVHRKYKTRRSSDKNVRYSVSVNNEELSEGITPKIEIQRVDVNENSDSDNDADTISLVRQMHGEQNSGEEWLDEDPYQITHIETYEPKPQRKRKYHTVKREVPSPTGLPGFYVAPKPNKIIYDSVNKKDEYSVFAEYVANKLRKIKTPRTRGNLQQLITTILWQAEYGVYDSADTVRRVLMMHMQPEQDVTVDFENNVQTEEVVEDREVNPETNQSGDSMSVIN